MISVIIPVYNEQQGLAATLARLCALEEQELLREVLVVQGPGERYDVPTLISPREGRAAQMNHAARLARGEILLFLHADTALPPNALALIAKAGAGAFSLRFASCSQTFRVLAWLATLRSRIFRLPYGDQALFLPKARFMQLGGYPEVPILEDVLLAKRLRPRVLPQAVLTSCRRYEQAGLLNTVLRHRLIMLGHSLGLRPERLARWR